MGELGNPVLARDDVNGQLLIGHVCEHVTIPRGTPWP